MYIGNIMLLVLNLPLVGILSRILYVPPGVLLCVILVIASAGVYSFNTDTFDLFLALFFGIVGYVFRKFDIPKAPLLFGLILGHTLEQSFRQALTISGGDPSTFVRSPIAAGLLCCAAISVIASVWSRRNQSTKLLHEVEEQIAEHRLANERH
jgi:putative tricarboxylic transport membrane protein